MNIIEQIKTELAAFQAKREQLVEQLRKEFGPMFTPLFEKYPEVKNVSWQQYTPYFNDGDECTFSTSANYPDFNTDLDGEDEYNEDMVGDDQENSYDGSEPTDEAKQAFTEILAAIPEDFYDDLFGNHVEVFLCCNGEVIVQEYDHE